MTFKDIKEKMESVLKTEKKDVGKILTIGEDGKIKLVSPKELFGTEETGTGTETEETGTEETGTETETETEETKEKGTKK